MDNSQGNRQGNRYVYWTRIGRCMDSSHQPSVRTVAGNLASTVTGALEVKRAVSPDLGNAHHVRQQPRAERDFVQKLNVSLWNFILAGVRA
jgi:hypothetical protein